MELPPPKKTHDFFKVILPAQKTECQFEDCTTLDAIAYIVYLVKVEKKQKSVQEKWKGRLCSSCLGKVQLEAEQANATELKERSEKDNCLWSLEILKNPFQ